MNYQVMPEADVVIQRIRRQRINPGYRFPSVSIFIPFNPKMGKKDKLVFSLSKATDKVITELKDKYPGEMSLLVIQKLKAIIKNLDFNTYKKSLAIFVSPVFEKVYYLNIEVEEKIIVSESLQIRDILHSRKQPLQFHILLLGDKESRLYLNASYSFIRIKHSGFDGASSGQMSFSGKEEYWDEMKRKKETAIEKNLQLVNHSLDMILERDNQAVFVFGDDTSINQFKLMPKNRKTVFEYAEGNFEEYSLDGLKKLMNQDNIDWKRIRQKHLTQQMRNASVNNKLSLGINDVRRDVINQGGRLLLINKRYLYEVSDWISADISKRSAAQYNRFSNIKNAIDEMIEKILESGGDVELIDDEILNEHDQIALIKN